MLKDADPLVVANCVIALEEILASEGGIVLTRDVAHRLLNMLPQFTAWSQSTVMTILTRYVPSNEDEIYDILNVLDDRLKDANSGVVMAAAKLFLHLTRNMEEMHEDVYERLKTPLITQMNSGSHELAFAILHHIEVLLSKAPKLLETEYASFFCRYNEPNYVKFKKIEILTLISTPDNIEAVVEELAAYITDVDVNFAKRSLQAVGQIAIKHPESADYIMTMLMLFLDLETTYVTSGTLVVLVDVLRKYPNLSEQIVDRVGDVSKTVVKSDDAEARKALLWLIGEFGSDIEEAPYILEDFVDKIEDETEPGVRLQMLTAAMKLFFARPPECQKLLGTLFEKMIDDDSHMDVHDRALLYYRLLRTNVDEARRVIAGSKATIEEFAERRGEVVDKVFEEFNSLACVYGHPADTFVDQRPPYNTVGLARPRFTSFGASGTAAAAARATASATSAHSSDNKTQVGNLLDVGAFSEGAGSTGGMQLSSTASMTPQVFEQKWTSSEPSLQIKDLLQTVPSTEDFERLMSAAHIKTLAMMPPQNGLLKYFLYAQESASGKYHLIEVVVEIPTRCLTASFKCDVPEDAPDFAVVFRGALSGM